MKPTIDFPEGDDYGVVEQVEIEGKLFGLIRHLKDHAMVIGRIRKKDGVLYDATMVQGGALPSKWFKDDATAAAGKLIILLGVSGRRDYLGQR